LLSFFFFLSPPPPPPHLFTIPPSLQSLETNSVFYSNLNCYVFSLLHASPSCSACSILAPHSWRFEVTHNDAPLSVGFSWMRGQLVSETSTWQHTHHSQQTNIHAPGGIRTHDPSRQRAVYLRLRTRGHWDRQMSSNLYKSSMPTCCTNTSLFPVNSTCFCLTFLPSSGSLLWNMQPVLQLVYWNFHDLYR